MEQNGKPKGQQAQRDRLRWQTVVLWGEFLAFAAFVLWLLWV